MVGENSQTLQACPNKCAGNPQHVKVTKDKPLVLHWDCGFKVDMTIRQALEKDKGGKELNML